MSIPMEMIQDKHCTSLNQLEYMVSTIEKFPKLFSRNYRIKSPMDCHNIWSNMVKQLNAMGPQTGIVNVWKRILYNLIHSIRKKIKHKIKLNSTERRLINLLEFMKNENNESEDHIEHDDEASNEIKEQNVMSDIEIKTEIAEVFEIMDVNQIDVENSTKPASPTNSESYTLLEITDISADDDNDHIDNNRNDDDDNNVAANNDGIIFDEEITIKEELIENNLTENPIKISDNIRDDDVMSTIESDVSSVSSISSVNDEPVDDDAHNDDENDVKNKEKIKKNREHEEMKLIYKTFIKTMEKQSEFYKGILDALNENNRIKKDMLKLKIKSYKMKKYAFHKEVRMLRHQRFRR